LDEINIIYAIKQFKYLLRRSLFKEKQKYTEQTTRRKKKIEYANNINSTI